MSDAETGGDHVRSRHWETRGGGYKHTEEEVAVIRGEEADITCARKTGINTLTSITLYLTHT